MNTPAWFLQLRILTPEYDIAASAYKHRRHDANHRELRRTYIEAKLRFRRWWRMAEAYQPETTR